MPFMPNPDAANVVTPPPTPDPNAPPTPPAGAAGMGGPQQPAPQQAPVQPQIDPQIAHTFKTGLAYNALQGPDTQNMSPTQRFFKGIVNSAILGMGAPTRPGEGWANAGSGAAQARKGVQEQQAQAQAAQQQRLQNQQEMTKEQREQQFVNAQIAHMHAETIASQHLSDLQDKEYHDRHNEAAQTMVDHLTEAGGVPPIDHTLPPELSAEQLRDAYIKDPKIRNAPDGYARHFFSTTDSSEVTWDDKAGNWVDADGTPANMTNHALVKVLDVPINAMTTKRPVLGSDINKVAGMNLVDPDKTYPVAPLDMDALNAKRLAQENEKSRTNATNRGLQQEADRQRHAEFDARRAPISARKETLQAELKELQNDPTATPASRQALIDKIGQQDDVLQELTDQEYPSTGKGKPTQKTTTTTPQGTTDPFVKLNTETVANAPTEVAPVVSLLVNGGKDPTTGQPLPAAATYQDAVLQLSQYQSKPGGRLSPDDFKKALETLKTHYDKLTPINEKRAAEDRSIKLAKLQALYPSRNIKDEDIDKYNDVDLKWNPI